MAKKLSIEQKFLRRVRVIEEIAQADPEWLESQLMDWPGWRDFIYSPQLSPANQELWSSRLEAVIARWRPRQSRIRRSKRPVGLDLSVSAKEALRDLAALKGVSQSALIEDLLKKAEARYVKQLQAFRERVFQARLGPHLEGRAQAPSSSGANWPGPMMRDLADPLEDESEAFTVAGEPEPGRNPNPKGSSGDGKGEESRYDLDFMHKPMSELFPDDDE